MLQQGSDSILIFHPVRARIIRKGIFASPDSMHSGIALHAEPTTPGTLPWTYISRVFEYQCGPRGMRVCWKARLKGRGGIMKGRRTEGAAGVAQTIYGDVGQQLHDNGV
jgi:hypothetical protein